MNPAHPANLPVVVRTATLAIALLASLASTALAQPPGGPTEADALDRVALVSIGAAGGFPAYQTATLRAGIQAGWIGADVRVGYGPQAGFAFGGAVRGYPSLPGLPIPIWIGGGVMATSGSPAPFAAAGAHVPVAPRWRLDLEAGAAWTRLGLERRVVPHLQVGVSYAFATTLPEPARDGAATAATERSERIACEAGPPLADRLGDALRAAERRFVDDARATYGSLYRDLRYTLTVTSERVDGDRATLVLAYDGSVREIASGRTVAASGRAEADFRWTGCGWSLTDLRY